MEKVVRVTTRVNDDTAKPPELLAIGLIGHAKSYARVGV
jgi:hypothetical protein